MNCQFVIAHIESAGYETFYQDCIGLFYIVFFGNCWGCCFFPKERVKNFILEKAKEQINLPIQLDDVGLSVFPRFAFHLKGFEVGSDKHALQASFDDFEIKASLSTLMGKEVNISDVKLLKPILKIFNANIEKEAKTHTSESDTDIHIEKQNELDMNFFISDLSIEDGEVWIFDEKNNNTLKLLDLDQKLSINFTEGHIITARGMTSIHEIWSDALAWSGVELGLNKNFTYDTKTQALTIDNSHIQLQDLKINLIGNVTIKDDDIIATDIKLTTKPTQLSSIFELLPSLQQKDWLTQGRFSVDGHVKGDFDLADAVASWEKTDSHITVSLEQGKLENKAYKVTFDPVSIETDVTPSQIHIKKIFLKSQESEIVTTGRITQYLNSPLLDLNLKSNVLLSEMEPWMEPQTFKSASGKTLFNMSIKGPADIEKMTIDGSGSFQNTNFEMPEMKYKIKNLNGTFQINNTQTSLKNISFKLGASDFNIASANTGSWKTFMREKDAMPITIEGQSNQVNYTDILPEGDQADSQEPEALVLPDLFYRLQGSGSYQIKALDYQKTTFKNIDAQFALAQGKLDIQNLKLQTFGGAFKGDGNVDFRPRDTFPFDLNIGLDNASVQKALTFATSIEKLVHVAPFLSANISLNTHAKGHLTNMLSLGLNDLTSKGTFFLKEAQFKNHPLQKKLSAFLSTPELKEFNLNEWAQKFSVKEGKLFVSDLNLKAKDFSFTVDGYQGLDGTQDFNIKALLPKRLEDKISNVVPSQIWSLMTAGNQGHFMLPFSSKGTVNAPTLTLNSQALTAQAKMAAKDKLNAKIQTQKDALETKVQDTVKNQLEKTLKDKVIPKPSDITSKEEVKDKAKDEIKNIGKKFKKLF